MPIFPGGYNVLAKFINSNLKYPEKYDGWKGIIYVAFVIDTLGKVINPCIIRGQLKSLTLTENDKEALKVISKLPENLANKMAEKYM